MAIAAAVGAAGIGSALIGANASQNASSQQVAEEQKALAQQQALYQQGIGTQAGYVGQAQSALAPYASAGQSVLPTLQGLITPGANQSALLSQTPGFQFASQYGDMAATNALAAKSGASAGPLAAAISQYNNGLAQNTWQGTVNALQNYAGLGANAAGSLGNIYGNAGNAALGGSIQAGNSQAGTLGSIGTAQAQGTLGTANALSGGLNSVGNAAIYNQLLNNNGGGGSMYQNSTGGYMGMTDAQQDALQDSGFNLPG